MFPDPRVQPTAECFTFSNGSRMIVATRGENWAVSALNDFVVFTLMYDDASGGEQVAGWEVRPEFQFSPDVVTRFRSDSIQKVNLKLMRV